MMEYKNLIIANRYFLLTYLEIGRRTLIMKSWLEDKIIKNLYYSEDTYPHKTENATFTPMGVDVMKAMFFTIDQGIKNIPYDWEYWQTMSNNAAAELIQWHKQEKERIAEVGNNENHNDAIDYLNSYVDKSELNPVPPFHLLQRQGLIPRLAVSIEDLCKILEKTGGDESEIKALQELIDNNNIDTKTRARTQLLKKSQGKGGVKKSEKTQGAREFIIFEYEKFVKDNPNIKDVRCYTPITKMLRENCELTKHLEDSNLEVYVRNIIGKHKGLKN